jgi:HSP20 family molecular chaperone IbpA
LYIQKMSKSGSNSSGAQFEKLEYVVHQEQDSISVSFAITAGLRSRDLDIKITSKTIKAGIKGKPAIIEGTFYQLFRTICGNSNHQ